MSTDVHEGQVIRITLPPSPLGVKHPGGTSSSVVVTGTTVARGSGPGAPRPRRQVLLDIPSLLSSDNLRRAGGVGVFWLVVVLVSAVAVCYLVGPLFETRSQVTRTQDLRLAVGQAYGAANNSLEGAVAPTRAPPVGSAVALVQIPRLALQQAVAEGASGQALRGGAGHVPGTAAPGQPGNSVVVARSVAFGGPFGDVDRMRVGDQVLVQTTQGASTYVVTSVEGRAVTDADYEPTQADTLTLLTSASWSPLNSSTGVVVRAELRGAAFVPTPQNGYTPEQDGRHGDSSAWPLLLLELLGLALGMVTAAVLYRRWSPPAAYLVSTPALTALTMFLTLTGSRLLPGWF